MSLLDGRFLKPNSVRPIKFNTTGYTPTNGIDLTTKDYVDFRIKVSCMVATNAQLNATYNSTTKKFTATANGIISIDSTSVGLNKRVLVKNQTILSENGIYVVTVVGDASTAFELTRAYDFDDSTKIKQGDFVFVSSGVENKASSWVLTTADPITLDTSSINFEPVSQIKSLSWENSAKSVQTTSVGLTPAIGDRYLVDWRTTAAGDFIGKEGQIAQWNGTTYDFTIPTLGTSMLIDADLNSIYITGQVSPTIAWSIKSFEQTIAGTGLLLGVDGKTLSLDPTYLNSSYIPISGTLNGVPVTGDIKFDNNSKISSNDIITNFINVDDSVDSNALKVNTNNRLVLNANSVEITQSVSGKPKLDFNTASESNKDTIEQVNIDGLTINPFNLTGYGEPTNIYFVNSTLGFSTDKGGVINKTIDAGVTWNTVFSKDKCEFNSVFFTSTTTGYAVGTFDNNGTWEATVFKTIDGGTTWTETIVATDVLTRDVYFSSANIGYVVLLNGVGENSGVIKTTDAGATWSTYTAITGTYSLNSVYFIDDSTGFAGGNSSTGFSRVLKTTDGGVNWTPIDFTRTGDILKIQFTSSTIGYALANDNFIYKTIDAGVTWNAGTSTGLDVSSDLYFVNSTIGYIMGSLVGNSAITKTTDGSAWSAPISNSTLLRFKAGHFFDSTNGILLGIKLLNSTIQLIQSTYSSTTDSGSTIATSTLKAFSNPNIRDIVFVDANNGFAACTDKVGHVLKTTNGGTTWTSTIVPDLTSTSEKVTSLFFLSSTVGFAGGVYVNDGRIYKTSDGGATWVQNVCGTPEVNAIHFTSTNNGFLVGGAGIISKTIDGGTSWTQTAAVVTLANVTKLTGIHFANTTIGAVVGHNATGGLISLTTDGGATWSVIANITGITEVTDIHFINTTDVIIIGKNASNGVILKSTNGGSTWSSPIILNGVVTLNKIYFKNTTAGYVTGHDNTNGKIFKTIDAGLTWSLVTTFTETKELNGIGGFSDLVVSAGVNTKSNDGSSFNTTNDFETMVGLRLYKNGSVINKGMLTNLATPLIPSDATNKEYVDSKVPLKSKGDILVSNGTSNIAFPIGTNGQIIAADSAEPSGIKWIAAPIGNITAAISTTYANLSSLRSSTSLITGQYYLITNPQDGGSILLIATSTSSLAPSGYWIRPTNLKAFGFFTLDSGATGNISQITVGATSLMTATINYTTSRINTANLVAANINANSGVSGFRATVVEGSLLIDKPYIIIEKNLSGVNTDIIAVTTTTLTIANKTDMSSGIASTPEVYDINYNFASDRIISCLDSSKNIKFKMNLAEINTNTYNSIPNFRWGDSNFKNIEIDSTKWKDTFIYSSSTTNSFIDVKIDKNVDMENFLLRTNATNFNNVKISSGSSFKNFNLGNLPDFRNSIINASFLNCSINDNLNMNSTTMENLVVFTSSYFGSSTNLSDTTFDDGVSFNNSSFAANNKFNKSYFKDFAITGQTLANALDYSFTTIKGSRVERQITISNLNGTTNNGLATSPIYLGNIPLGFFTPEVFFEGSGLTGLGASLAIGIEVDDEDCIMEASPITTLNTVVDPSIQITKSTVAHRRIVAIPSGANITAGSFKIWIKGLIGF